MQDNNFGVLDDGNSLLDGVPVYAHSDVLKSESTADFKVYIEWHVIESVDDHSIALIAKIKQRLEYRNYTNSYVNWKLFYVLSKSEAVEIAVDNSISLAAESFKRLEEAVKEIGNRGKK